MGDIGTNAPAHFNCLMAIVLGSTVVTEIFVSGIIHYADVWVAMAVFPYLLPFVFLAWYCHWVRYHRMRDLLLCAIWPFALSVVAGPLVEIAGRSSFPLVDGALARIDGYTFQTVTVVRWLQHFPPLSSAFDAVYVFLSPPLVLAPLLVTNFCRQPNAARRYIVSVTIALVLTTLLFALWPAAGPWTVEGFRPNEVQAAAESHLLALKLHHPVPGTARSAGIVSFPSFHTIIAVLAASALWNIRWIRWVGLVVCVGICLSTVTTGWHYVIDVLGGLGVAFAAWAAAVRLIRD